MKSALFILAIAVNHWVANTAESVEPHPLITTTLACPKESAPGTEVLAEIVVNNKSKEELLILVPPGPEARVTDSLDIDGLDSSGRPARRTVYAEALQRSGGSRRAINIASGQTYSFKVNVARRLDLTFCDTYKVRSTVEYWIANKRYFVRSNTEELKVTNKNR